ncbi:alkaline phosphatase family protein [uncultured Rikenella sp.]|uniref:alkaline phosphatase family protein n=1 Tax=uncultured Rikenella sp. TaxID=368003 RepID=UPI00261DEE45|nr:alkaline phosphatase family protein [uncultured Rikenella sp.]
MAAASGTAAMPQGLMAMSESKPKKEGEEKAAQQHRKVLMPTLDGIRVDGFKKACTPNLDRVFAEGAPSTPTRVGMPSFAQPNRMSHLSGSGSEIHGVNRNDWAELINPYNRRTANFRSASICFGDLYNSALSRTVNRTHS